MKKLDDYIIWERPCWPGMVYYAALAVITPHVKYFGRPWCKTYGFWRRGLVCFAWPKKEFAGNALYIGRNFLKDSYFKKKIKQDQSLANKVKVTISAIDKIKFNKLSNEDFLKLVVDFYKDYLDWWGFAQVAEPAAAGLEQILLKNRELTQEQISVLTAPTKESYTIEEENELYRQALIYRRTKKISSLWLAKHVKKYFWLNNSYANTYYLKDSFFLNRIKQIAKKYDSAEIKRFLKRNGERLRATKKKILSLEKELEFDQQEKKIISRIDWLADYQDKRKAFSVLLNYYTDLMIKEVSRRSKINYDLIKFALPMEYPEILHDRFDLSRLKARQEHFAIIFTLKGDTLKEGQAARILKEKILGKGVDTRINEFEGQRAMGGKIIGKARVILNNHQMKEMKRGEILVTTMTSPDFVPAMKKAIAIVTDEGGITCHAAIISREMGLPCVIGTKIATRVLKTGDKIQVNANHGLIKKLS